MYSHGYNWRDEPEGTSFTSVILLLVFVGAVAFLLSMMYFQPWDENPSTTTLPEVQVPAEAVPADGAAPPAVENPAPAQ
jgi:hypothetical protein